MSGQVPLEATVKPGSFWETTSVGTFLSENRHPPPQPSATSEIIYLVEKQPPLPLSIITTFSVHPSVSESAVSFATLSCSCLLSESVSRWLIPTPATPTSRSLRIYLCFYRDECATKLTLSRFELFLLGEGEKKITEQIFTGKQLPFFFSHSAIWH